MSSLNNNNYQFLCPSPEPLMDQNGRIIGMTTDDNPNNDIIFQNQTQIQEINNVRPDDHQISRPVSVIPQLPSTDDDIPTNRIITKLSPYPNSSRIITVSDNAQYINLMQQYYNSTNYINFSVPQPSNYSHQNVQCVVKPLQRAPESPEPNVPPFDDATPENTPLTSTPNSSVRRKRKRRANDKEEASDDDESSEDEDESDDEDDDLPISMLAPPAKKRKISGDQCPKCKKIYKTPGYIFKHLAKCKKTPSIKVFKCKKCERGYISSTELDEHKQTHTERQGSVIVNGLCWKCPRCHLPFNTENGMKKHFAVKHQKK